MNQKDIDIISSSDKILEEFQTYSNKYLNKDYQTDKWIATGAIVNMKKNLFHLVQAYEFEVITYTDEEVVKLKRIKHLIDTIGFSQMTNVDQRFYFTLCGGYCENFNKWYSKAKERYELKLIEKKLKRKKRRESYNHKSNYLNWTKGEIEMLELILQRYCPFSYNDDQACTDEEASKESFKETSLIDKLKNKIKYTNNYNNI